MDVKENRIIKHSLFLLVFSMAGLFFRNQLAYALHGLLALHNLLATWLASVFSGDSAGQLIQAIIALILLPVIAGGLTGLIAWLVKKDFLEYTMHTIWVVWLILLCTMLAQAA